MSLRTILLFAAFLLSCLIFHLYTLDLNPLPWIDEIFFSSISRSLEETGKFIPLVSKEMWHSEEVFIYGPLHFLLGAASFKLFGFGILQYRWITLLCGLFTILATVVLIRLYHPSRRLLLLAAALFLLDPFMNLSMHEGRMDLVTTFFMLVSILFLLKGLREKRLVLFSASGLFASAALLTTPRIGFVFVAMFIVFLFSLEGLPLKDSLKKLLSWSLPILIIYYSWVLYAFGGIGAMIDYYQNIRQTNGEYLGGRWYIPKHEYILIALTAVSVIYGIIQRKRDYFNPAVFISLLSIGLFYLVVLDWGPYSAIILPFYYFLFFHSLANTEFSFKKIVAYPVLLLFVFNAGYFFLKSAQVLSEREKRNPEVADSFVRKHIPEGSRVVGDAQYYYAVIRSGSDYRCYDDFQPLEERERMLREDYGYDYLIVSRRAMEKDPAIVSYFLKHAEVKKVAVLETPVSPEAYWINKLGIVSPAERFGYDAIIFVRIKRDEKNLALSACRND